MQKLAGRYRVGEILGQGGGGAVVRYGFDGVLKRPVAIKMFDSSATEVLREARMAAGLSHPNIAQVYDYGEIVDGHDRTPYLVMEFVGGETLAERITRTGALRWRRAAEICAETAGALAAAHALDLVHRDVNPRNVMLTTDGGVKVLDFGIAAVAGAGGAGADGGLWGSPSYLAPEQLRGEPSFPAGDVYALGLLLFECLTGSRAWPGETIGAILATRHGRPAPRLPRLAGLPRDLVRLYEALTAEEADGRPTALVTAETFRRLARPAPLSRPVRPVVQIPAGMELLPPPASRRRSRRRATVVGSVAVAAAIVSILGMQLANGTATPGGREVEAAVEGVHPAATTSPPSISTPAPSASVRGGGETTGTTTTVKSRKRTTPPSATPTSVPTSAPATKPPTSAPATPSSPPVTTPPVQPPSPTVDPKPTDPKPTEPTDDPTTEPPATTPPPPNPPTSTGPETPAEAAV